MTTCTTWSPKGGYCQNPARYAIYPGPTYVCTAHGIVFYLTTPVWREALLTAADRIDGAHIYDLETDKAVLP